MDKQYLLLLEKIFKDNGRFLKNEAPCVALIEASLYKNENLDEWEKGKINSLPIVNLNNKIKYLETFSDVNTKIAKWSQSLRKSIVMFCKESNLPIEDKFSTLRLSSSSPESLKNIGAVYTPIWLSDYITSLSYLYWGQLHRTGKKPDFIADFSCGTGVFLSSAKKFYGDEPKIFGQDIDKISTDYALLLTILKNINAEIKVNDSLLSPKVSWFNNQNQKFDIIIGNPPYIRGSNLKENYVKELQKRFPDIISGNFDLVVPFIKQAADSLNPGGIVSCIVSSKFMHSKYGKNICNFLANDVRLINIVDFKDAQLFDGYITYTSILTFAKLKPVDKLSVTYFPGQIKNKEDLKKSKKFTLLSKNLLEFPWNLSTSENQTILNKIFNKKNPSISDIFDGVLQGLRTGINDVFIVTNDFSKDHGFEKKYILPYVNGECIRKGALEKNKYSIIYPYKLNGSGSELVLENELLNNAPNIYKYLKEKKNRLIESSNKIERWYGYSRPQNLTIPFKKKILIKEMMPQAEFAADIKGELVISSGYAIIAQNINDNEIIMWSWIFNTPIMEFVLRQSGTQLHSGWFRLMKGHLDKVKLPILTENQKHLAIKIIIDSKSDTQNILEKLNEIVAKSFDLTKEELSYINDFLKSLHDQSLKGRQVVGASPKKILENSDLYYPVKLEKFNKYHTQDYTFRQLVTFQKNKKMPIHRWYSFTQGFSDGLIEKLIEKMDIKKRDLVLDPFSGSGTTLLSCLTRGIDSIGIEISPFMAWVNSVKVESLKLKNPELLFKKLDSINPKNLLRENNRDLIFDDYLSKAFSKNILSQIINLNYEIESLNIKKEEKNILQLGLIGILEDVSQVRKHGSHYRFLLNENSIGLQKINTKIIDPSSEILSIYKNKIMEMMQDIIDTQKTLGKESLASSQIINADVRSLPQFGRKPNFVITSPPYLNRNNYIAQQKIELALLSFIKTKDEYKELVKKTFRSHTDSDLNINPKEEIDVDIKKIITNINLSENNNPKIPEMIIGYFIDLKQTLVELNNKLAKGAKLAFVVGNSRWGGVVVPVDHILLNMAEKIGFKTKEIIVTRLKGNSPQQMHKYGKISVRESIVIFEKI